MTLTVIRLATAIALSPLVAPLAIEAQQPTKSYRIRFLSAAAPLATDEAFRRGLSELASISTVRGMTNTSGPGGPVMRRRCAEVYPRTTASGWAGR